MKDFVERFFWWIISTSAILMVIFLQTFFNMELGEALIWVAIRYSILYVLLILVIVSIMFWGIYVTELESHEKRILLSANVLLLSILVFALFWVYWMTIQYALMASGIVIALAVAIFELVVRLTPTSSLTNIKEMNP